MTGPVLEGGRDEGGGGGGRERKGNNVIIGEDLRKGRRIDREEGGREITR